MLLSVCLIVLLLSVWGQVSDPETWTVDTSGDYYYKAFTAAVTFDQARTACQALTEFGDLASVRHDSDLTVFNTLSAPYASFLGLVWNTDHWEYLNSDRDPLLLPDFKGGEPNGNAGEPCGARFTDGAGFNDIASYEAGGAAWAVGDPHIMSIWGCKSEAPLNQTDAVLMHCDSGEYESSPESLSIQYNEEWGNHIHTVEVRSGQEHMKFPWKYLKYPKTKTVCGNTIEFHRYYAGVNLRSVRIANRNFTGLMADKSCHQ